MKIIFEHIVIDNFLSIGHAELTLNSSGITLISGKNLFDSLSSSNGSGKSSIFEAILWNLTGYTSRGSSAVSNIMTAKPAYVELSFIADDSSYVVKRKADPSSLQILKDKEDISGNTFTKSKKVLAEALGFVNYDMLSSIIILTQGLNGRLSNLKASERKARLEMFSNLQELIEAVTEEVNEASNTIADEYLSVSKDINSRETKIQHNKELISSYTNKIKDTQANQEKILSPAELDDLNQTISEYELKLKITEEELNKTIKSRTELETKKRTCQQQITSLTAKIAQLKTDYQKIQNCVCPTCGQPINNPELLATYEAQLNSLKETLAETEAEVERYGQELLIDNSFMLLKDKESLSKGIAEARQTVYDSMKYSASVDTWNSMIDSLQTEIKDLETELFPLKAKVSALNKDSQIAKWYKQAISRKFRNFLLDNVIGFMNKRLTHYSKYLFTDRTVHFESDGNNLSIKLDSLDFDNLSGGEGRRVDLLIQLALRDLAINQSGFYCNLLVMDEVFDYLDDTGINNFMLMLDKETAFSESLMVITHRTGVEIPVAQRIIVTKQKNGVSSVKVIQQDV